MGAHSLCMLPLTSLRCQMSLPGSRELQLLVSIERAERAKAGAFAYLGFWRCSDRGLLWGRSEIMERL